MKQLKLTSENYYTSEANKLYASNSQIKDFQRCEYKALKKLNGEIPDITTDAMLMGSYVDEALTGDLEKFKDLHPEIIARTGVNKGCLKASFQKCEEMVAVAKADKKFMQYISGDKQVIMTGEIFGLPIKIKMDAFDEKRCITDLKTTESLYKPYWNNDLKCYQTFVEALGYIQQMAIYQEIVFQNIGKRLPCFLAVITKEENVNHEVIKIDDESMHDLIYGNEFSQGIQPLLNRIKDIKDGIVVPAKCGVCDLCIKEKKIDRPISLTELMGRLN